MMSSFRSWRPSSSRSTFDKTADLRIQESALTGEADAVTKLASALKTADLPLAEQANMAFFFHDSRQRLWFRRSRSDR